VLESQQKIRKNPSRLLRCAAQIFCREVENLHFLYIFYTKMTLKLEILRLIGNNVTSITNPQLSNMEKSCKKVLLFFTSLLLLAPIYGNAATATRPAQKHHTPKHVVSHKKHAAAQQPKTKTTAKKAKHHTHHAKATHKKAHPTLNMSKFAVDDTNTMNSDDNTGIQYNQSSPFSVASEQKLVNLAGQTVRNLRQTSYKFGGNYFDTSRGVYKLDCSAYVNNLLEEANPRAYSSLTEWSRTYKPNSSNYYDFFNRLPSSNWGYWHKISQVDQLAAGDILVFRYSSLKHRSAGGHVMVVMGKPTVASGAPNVFWVSVADSAASGHSDDTRPAHTSGVGIGKLLLKVNPNTKQVDAYAWKAGSNWKHNTKFVMASPGNNKLG
jgi:hypothetical protein